MKALLKDAKVASGSLCVFPRAKQVVLGWVDTRLGFAVLLVWTFLLAAWAGNQVWRYYPREKPAKVLEMNASAEWRGGRLWLIVNYRVDKSRDCPYSSERFVEFFENDGTGSRLRVFRLEGARSGLVKVHDTSWHTLLFRDVGDILEPGTKAWLNIQGQYTCPENNYPADEMRAEFVVPPKPLQ